MHRRSKATKTHELRPLLPTCAEHPNDVAVAVCLDDSTLLCHLCVIAEHRTHHVTVKFDGACARLLFPP
jgi:hypothetical protein